MAAILSKGDEDEARVLQYMYLFLQEECELGHSWLMQKGIYEAKDINFMMNIHKRT